MFMFLFNFILGLDFIFALFVGMVMYGNKFGIKIKKNKTWNNKIKPLHTCKCTQPTVLHFPKSICKKPNSL